MKNKSIGFCVCMLMIVAGCVPATGALLTKENPKPFLIENDVHLDFTSNELIVKIKQGITFSAPSLKALNIKNKVYSYEKVFPDAKGTLLDNIYLLHVPEGSSILSLAREYASSPDVVYAEPNAYIHPCSLPNDANISYQWYIHNTGQPFWYNYRGTPDADIDAPEAWDIETGSSDVVIAIIDSGIDYTHPDLVNKIWNNTDEIPGNGIDDDHNGYIDDTMGWDFYYNDSDPRDGHGHGTMCAGVATAEANNGIGMAGVAWNCYVMPIQIANEYWSTTIIKAVKGIRYAADNGADILSMSWGLGNFSTLKNGIDYAYGKGVFLCAAAGNSNTSTKMYPAAFENVTAVAMTNQDDKRCSPDDWGGTWGSNYGDWVDIAAPGNLIYTTLPTYWVYFNEIGAYVQNYDFGCGSSFASPMVAGEAALLLSKDPTLTLDEIKTLICENVDPYISTEYIGTGRINAQKALTALQLSQQGDLKITGGMGVSLSISNNGAINLTNITWKIQVNGGILGFINKTVNGVIDLKEGETKTVSTGMMLGIGRLSISAKILGLKKTGNGTQLLIYSLVK